MEGVVPSYLEGLSGGMGQAADVTRRVRFISVVSRGSAISIARLEKALAYVFDVYEPMPVLVLGLRSVDAEALRPFLAARGSSLLPEERGRESCAYECEVIIAVYPTVERGGSPFYFKDYESALMLSEGERAVIAVPEDWPPSYSDREYLKAEKEEEEMDDRLDPEFSRLLTKINTY